MLNLLKSGSTVSIIVGVLTAVGVYGFAYNAGFDSARSKQARLLERITDNYVQILVNEKIERHAAIGYERQYSREGYEMAQTALEAGEDAIAANRAALAEKIRFSREAEARETMFLNRLEAMKNDWLQRRVPSDIVCELYVGVRDITGCAGDRATATSEEFDGSVGVLRPEPASVGGDDRGHEPENGSE
ncbi:MAG: hypothetical protein QNI84_14020 [Henriciella sp.]|nr:hypothetical protein [Henriciella sp.]